jgi:hypothetical protein
MADFAVYSSFQTLDTRNATVDENSVAVMLFSQLRQLLCLRFSENANAEENFIATNSKVSNSHYG